MQINIWKVQIFGYLGMSRYTKLFALAFSACSTIRTYLNIRNPYSIFERSPRQRRSKHTIPDLTGCDSNKLWQLERNFHYEPFAWRVSTATSKDCGVQFFVHNFHQNIRKKDLFESCRYSCRMESRQPLRSAKHSQRNGFKKGCNKLHLAKDSTHSWLRRLFHLKEAYIHQTSLRPIEQWSNSGYFFHPISLSQPCFQFSAAPDNASTLSNVHFVIIYRAFSYSPDTPADHGAADNAYQKNFAGFPR